MSIAPSVASQWQTWRETANIKIATLPHSSGINYIDVEAFFAGVTVNALLNVMSDTKSAPKWLSSSKSVKVIARPTPAEAVVYTYFDSPWPVSDRDMLTHSCLSQLGGSQYRLDILSTTAYETPQSRALRITPVRGFWLLTQTRKGLQIKHRIYADPNGALPIWLVNNTALNNIFKSFKSLEKILKTPKYHNTKSAFSAGDCSAFEALHVVSP
ncbi:cyclase [Pseudoalteromonas sp. A25]|uniref:START domain-containing protein n=1 Tax=Pseudoalteromonas sp. A25 TaxID=116092 RepID=UPI0012A0212C|nr:START domain-containing protein [Pseudoalteromonas sp. A25]BBN80803.1 cyclase [Pseudoalteromonas sp. A25]